MLDNDSAGVTFTGAWSDSTTGARYYDEDYGAVADAVRYRFASTTRGAETATATYTPNIPAAGFYPVYTWVARGTNRTTQLYRDQPHRRVRREIRVDHSKVGNGWVYLGTYHFNTGSSATLGLGADQQQCAAAGKVVIADAIRFGNGMGDCIGRRRAHRLDLRLSARGREFVPLDRSAGSASGQRSTKPSVVRHGNVSAPSNMAAIHEPDGIRSATRVYVGFHSNGHGRPDTATPAGLIGLIDVKRSARRIRPTSHLYLGRQINQDMQSSATACSNTTGAPARRTRSPSSFGEIDLGAGAEMDATIIEVAFHDNVQDGALHARPEGARSDRALDVTRERSSTSTTGAA